MPATIQNNIPRAAIVGIGGFGSLHVLALSVLAKEGLCQIVAGCDPYHDPSKDQKAAALSELQVYKTSEEMLCGHKFDYIVIASPPHLHEEQTIQALDHGAFVYLEKPPVPTFHQLQTLLKHPRSNQVAVGFQMLESPALRSLKERLNAGDLGKVHEISASALWPRAASYYQRASWAGKMRISDRPIFDGPMTNALAHIVQNVFFLAGHEKHSCATPKMVSGFYARARPIDSYDFAWIKGTTENDIAFNILAGHCADQIVPWKISVRTDKGTFYVEEKDVPSTELLLESHRSALAARKERKKPTTGLSDCLGYSMSTSLGLVSSSGIHTIPPSEIELVGTGAEEVYHVESIFQLIKNGQKTNSFSAMDAGWIRFGEQVDCKKFCAKKLTVFSIFFPATCCRLMIMANPKSFRLLDLEYLVCWSRRRG